MSTQSNEVKEEGKKNLKVEEFIDDLAKNPSFAFLGKSVMVPIIKKKVNLALIIVIVLLLLLCVIGGLFRKR